MLDAARDAYDALRVPDEMFLPGTDHSQLRKQLLEKAEADGFDIEEPNTRVANAAQSLGRGKLFRYMNKTLSKFAHPTAFAILTLGTSEEQLLKSKFISIGLFFADVGLMYCDLRAPVVDPFASA